MTAPPDDQLEKQMHRYAVVDAFADEPLRGNPVAVFFDADDLSAAQMQRIAREMNLSETTFVLAAQHGGDARIRIFTPVNELPFAGHPMLGTAIALGAESDAGPADAGDRDGDRPLRAGPCRRRSGGHPDAPAGADLGALRTRPTNCWRPWA